MASVSFLLRRWAGALLAALLMPSLALAHPHGWVDLRVQLLRDDQGRATALQQRWRLDPFYSLVLLEELGQAADGFEAGLDRLGSEMRETLRPQGYFTELTLDGAPLATDEVTDSTVLARDGRVVLLFRLPLAEPVALAGRTLRYRIFDPSYYLEMLHEDAAPRREALTVSGAPGCQVSIVPADPDPEQVLAAALLDRDDTAAPGLGRHFAETGEITCD